ncbi:MAG: hypothetical protein AB1698_21730 [Pseudomonadota bacterium]
MSMAITLNDGAEGAPVAARPDGDPRAVTALRTLVARSAYRAMLEPIAQDVERIALANVQVHGALDVLARRPLPARRFWERPSPEEAIVLAFLEYVAFASPTFLTSVGEWPLGQLRG